MKSKMILCATAALALCGLAEAASVTSVATTNGTEFAGARLRYGATGAEAYVGRWDVGVAANRTQLNYAGAPAWGNGTTYSFEMLWDNTTGKISLKTSVDNTFYHFTVGERAGFGPDSIFLSLRGNDTHTIRMGNLKVNGVATTGIANPNLVATVANQSAHYKIDNVGGLGFTSLSGEFLFSWQANTAQERPVINIMMADPTNTVPGPVVPLPAAAWAGLALMGAVGARKLRK